MAKSYEELQFTDDFMFGKVMEDKELCRDVLECLLQEPVGTLQDVQTEHGFQYTSDGKPIRLDVYTKDDRAIYDAEMQNLNRKKVKTLALPKRSRFYQSTMDVDFLQKGNPYQDLPEGKVLFICTFDPFGQNLPKYTFQNKCDEDGSISLYDGTFKIFCNCMASTENLPESLQDLYNYISKGKANSPLTRKIEAAVEEVKCNEKWRSEYMKELLIFDDYKREGREEGIEEGIEQGIEQGMQKAREDGIRIFIQDKLDDGIDRETILAKLRKLYALSTEEAEKYLLLFTPHSS